MHFAEVRAGAAAVAPMLIGVVPFGLVAGATPAVDGLGLGAAVGLSTIVFAGASQLAAADVLADGGSALVATLAACTINLRMLLYSASLAPLLAGEPLRRRLAAAYLLTDQAYAVSITRWTATGNRPEPAGSPGQAQPAGSPDQAQPAGSPDQAQPAGSPDQAQPAGSGGEAERRLPFYFGAGLLLWVVWQVCTVAGALIGAAVPEDLPLDFAVPLVFLVLLVPAISSRPAAMAALLGGGAAVVAAEAGLGPLSVMVGAVAGIIAGAAAETVLERRRPPEPPPATGLDVGAEDGRPEKPAPAPDPGGPAARDRPGP